MNQLVASLIAETLCVEHDPELTAIAARLSETASYAINPSFEEELRETLLHQFKDHFAIEQATGATTRSQATEIGEQTGRDTLILSFLDSVDALLRTYAASAHLDYEDLRQDACLLIMDILEHKPERTHTRAYIATSVRNRILSKIAYIKRREAKSLDVPVGNGNETLADFLPSGYSVDPMLVMLAREERLQTQIRAKEALRSLSPRKRRTKKVQKALALFQEEGQL